MFSHIMLGANNIEESKKFYDETLSVLGREKGVIDPKGRCFYFDKSGVFALSVPINGEPASGANGSTIGFLAKTPELVDEWHKVGLANGGKAIEDPPGVREGNGQKLYLAYLRDPAGNKICALHNMSK